MAVGQNQWYHFGVGEFTTHFRNDFSGWIGMFTRGYPIWLLTHGHFTSPKPANLAPAGHPEDQLPLRFIARNPPVRCSVSGGEGYTSTNSGRQTILERRSSECQRLLTNMEPDKPPVWPQGSPLFGLHVLQE